jgi:RNA polymerase sigma-70 factor (ECF subfamily)
VTPESDPAPATEVCGVSREQAELIRAAQRGDQEAFERLVRSYDRGVLRLAWNVLRSVEDAQEVYQETFLRAYRNLGSFRADSNFQTWLYRIAWNLCLDYLRKRKTCREENAGGDGADGFRSPLETVAEQRPEADPQRMLVNRVAAGRIRQALDRLTPRERMVFELRHFHGLRLRAIAEIAGSSEEAVKTCLFRATQKLRAALGDLI